MNMLSVAIIKLLEDGCEKDLLPIIIKRFKKEFIYSDDFIKKEFTNTQANRKKVFYIYRCLKAVKKVLSGE